MTLPPSSFVARKLWDITSCSPLEGYAHVRAVTEGPGQTQPETTTRGMATESEAARLISPSFAGMVKEFLPMPTPSASPAVASFGGLWFWETYRHGLAGEQVVVDLSGTCVNLAEDNLDAQRACRKRCLELAPAGVSVNTHPAAAALVHTASKLEVLLAVAMSVALHVTQQPLLEDGEGPQALLLCATKDECDEMAFLLERLACELHLVVHNLFAPPPSIPGNRRAEVVVATPPLWESVAALPPPDQRDSVDKITLEHLLCHVTGEAVPPTYARTRWRPYSTSRLSQVVLWDLERQLSAGFGPALLRWVRRVGPQGALPPPWQMYVVCDGSGEVDITDGAAPLRDAFLTKVTAAGARCGYGTCRVGFTALPCVRKRGREGENAEEDPTQRQMGAPLPLQSGLLVRHALSLARFLADPSTLADLEAGLLTRCAAFWTQFDGKPLPPDPAVLRSVLDVRLAFLATPSEARDPTRAPGTTLRELALLVRGTPATEAGMRSRLLLLLRHLEERLTGTVFDGSVMACCLLDQSHPEHGSPAASVHESCHNHPFLTPQLVADAQPVVVLLPSVGADAAREAAAALTRSEARWKAVELAGVARVPQTPGHDDITPTAFPANGALEEEEAPRGAFTVLALRDVGATVADLCAREDGTTVAGQVSTSPSSHSRKAFVQYVLEECCQYGKVLSYFCYEGATTAPTAAGEGGAAETDTTVLPSGRSSRSSSACSTSSSSCSDNVRPTDDSPASSQAPGKPQTRSAFHAATIFVEFATSTSAREAARMFARRFASTTREGNSTVPHTQLVRNELYYAGVAQESRATILRNSTSGENHDCIADDDDDDDFMLDISYLAE